MNTNEFVACWKAHKENLLAAFLEPEPENKSMVAEKITLLNLRPDQLPIMRDVVDGILTDALYSLLLGLAGAASIGDIQQPYQLYDESGNLISDCDELESQAFEQFHGDTA